MNFNIKHTMTAAVLSIMSTAANSQNLNTGYFNDGYLYRHEINPAFGNDQGYVAFPGIGNVNASKIGNIGVKQILFNINGRTATFLHPEVSTEEFLKGVKDKNRIAEDLKLQVLGFGFKGMNGYNTFEINVRENASLNVPGELLRLAKEGPANKTYDIKDLAIHADAYTELALGHSHQLNDNLRIGAKLKILLGLGNVDVKANKAILELNENGGFSGTVDAEVQASIKNLTLEEKKKMRGAEGQEVEHTYVSDVKVDKFGLNGFGLAVDLGAEYKIDDNWSVSASLLDLGFIGWNNNILASTNGEQKINTNDYIFNPDDDAENSFEREFDRMGEGLADLYEIHNKGNQGSRSKALAATMNLGVEYTPDFYDKLSFGFLNSTRMAGKYSWTDFRLSANVSPTNIFSASASVSAGTFGASFGWLLNFHPRGFNIFAGMDHTFFNIAKQGVPLAKNSSFSVGINFPFGK